MGNSFVKEAAADAFFGIAQCVEVKLGREKPLPGNGKSDAGRIHCDPAPPPLLGNTGRRAGAAGRVKHEIARVGSHKQATLNYFCTCLDYINGVHFTSGILPQVW